MSLRRIAAIPLLAGLLLFAGQANAQTPVSESMLTVPERTGYERTSTLAEVNSQIEALRRESSLLHRETLLVTREGRDVPLLVLADPPLQEPPEDHDRLVVYLQGNIHGGEVEGKEALQILLRDILFGDKRHLLDNQILVVVPVYNADGNDAMSADSRPSQEGSPPLTGLRTAHGLDLNRDGMIQEADETRALFDRVINRWGPDLFVDLHTTNGTWHGYSLTYAPSYHTAGDPATSDYTAEVMLPAIQASIKEKFNLDFGWYGGFDYRQWPPTELRTYHHAPRYLTNQMALRNRMAILSEAFAHERFDKRIHATNALVEEILEYSNRNADEILRINRAADQRVTRGIGPESNGVRFAMVPRDEPLDLLSYRYIPYIQADGSTAWARSGELVVTEGVLNYNAFAAMQTARVPERYYFDAELSELAERLRRHGIQVNRLTEAVDVTGEVFAVTEVLTLDSNLNGHSNTELEGQFLPASRRFEVGDFEITIHQRLANLIFYLLEPQSDDGLVFWNVFDASLEAELIRSESAEFPVFKALP